MEGWKVVGVCEHEVLDWNVVNLTIKPSAANVQESWRFRHRKKVIYKGACQAGTYYAIGISMGRNDTFYFKIVHA